MTVQKSQLISLFKELGFAAADSWSDARFQKKLASLPEAVQDEEMEATTEDGKALLDKLVRVVTNNKDVAIENDVAEANGAGKKEKKAKKKTKAAATEASEDGEAEASEESSEEAESDDDLVPIDEAKGSGKAKGKSSKAKGSKSAKAAKSGGKKASSANGGSNSRGPRIGIIDEIINQLKKASAKKPVTKAKILEALVKKFPDRPEASMKNTVGIQVPYWLTKQRKPALKVKAVETKEGGKGYFIPE